MLEACIGEIQQHVNSALALALAGARGAAIKRATVEGVWVDIISSINECTDFTDDQRGWLKYQIHSQLDAIGLHRRISARIEVQDVVDNLPTRGEPPEITEADVPRIVPF